MTSLAGLLALAASAGCGGRRVGADGGLPDASVPACQSGLPACAADAGASTCPNQTSYTCQAGCCVFVCLSASDCASDPCSQGALGCVCDLGSCKPRLCSADGECSGGLLCKGGDCLPADAAAASCTITPALLVVHAGAKVALGLAAFDAAGGTARFAAPATWTVSDATGTIDGALQFEDSRPSLQPGDVTIGATIGGASCQAHATVYSPAAAPRLTVLDRNAALPLAGATVIVSAAADGGLRGQPVVGGDRLGRYDLSGLDLSGGNLLTVFAEQHQYSSVVIPSGGFGATPDLVMVLAQTPPFDLGTEASELGGFGGDFSKGVGPFADAGASTALLFGLAGTALSVDPTELSVTTLFGPPVAVPLGGGQALAAPVGAQLDLSGTPLTCAYEGLGAAGGCGTDVLDGGDLLRCGRRPAWGLGGPVAESLVLGLLAGSSAPTLPQVLAAAAPSFPSFSSAIAAPVNYQLAPPKPANLVPNSCNASQDGQGTAIVPDAAKLSAHQLELAVPLDLVANVTLPALPALGGQCIEDVLVLTGALSPGVGFVPLGLSASSVLSADAGLNSQCLTYDPLGASQADGKLALHLAPAHGGLEGSRYAVLAVAGLGSVVNAFSGLIETFEALPFGSSVNFGQAGFLGLPQGASYTAATRTFAVGQGLTAGSATLLRLRFTDNDGQGHGTNRQWVVSLSPSVASVTLPVPPIGYEDRTRGSLHLGSALETQVEALQLQPSDTATALVDFSNGAIALDLFGRVKAFSSLQILQQ